MFSSLRHKWCSLGIFLCTLIVLLQNTFRLFGLLIFWFWVYWSDYSRKGLLTGFVTRVTRRVPRVEQKPTNLSAAPVFTPVLSWVIVARSFVFCAIFCRSLFVFLFFFLLAIVLSVLLRYTSYTYHFGILKLFFHSNWPNGFREDFKINFRYFVLFAYLTK